MLQRIQSIYLLAAGLLIGCLFILPLAEASVGNVIGNIFLWSLSSADKGFKWVMYLQALCFAFSGLGSLIVIFLYKNRRKQLNWTRIILLLLTAGFVCMVLSLLNSRASVQGGIFFLRPVVLFPPIAFILLLLARRSVKKDQDLVDSLDRIR